MTSGSAPAKNPAVSATPAAKKPAVPAAASEQTAKMDNVQGAGAGGSALGVSQKVAAIVKDPKRRKWLALGAAGVAAIMLFFTCLGVGGLALYLKGRGGSGGLFVRGDGEDANLPPIDKTNIEPLPIPAGTTSELPHQVRERLKSATVFIKTTNSGRKGSGSGFFGTNVPDIVLTNAHVVDMLEPDSKKPEKIEITLNSGEKNSITMPGEVIGVDRTSDLALVRVKPAAGQEKLLPTPLEVKVSKKLFQTQKLVVVGFPLGEAAGKEITFSGSEVSSLRKDEHGNLDKVQCNGGIDHGNSGGPVIDLVGNVVGVVVSGFEATSVKFAIPGEHVHLFVNGRLENVVIDQPYLQDGKVKAHITVTHLDPLKRIRESGVMVWGGKPGSSRPPSETEPAPEAGDGSKTKLRLRNKDETVVQDDVNLPSLQQGQVYWIQPYWINGRGEKRWAKAVTFDLTASPPVERKPATLVFKQQVGQRPLTLSRKATTKQEGDIRDVHQVIDTNYKIQEVTQSVDGAGTADIRLEYKNMTVAATLNKEPVPLEKMPSASLMMQNITNITGLQKIDRNNKVIQNQVQINNLPIALRSRMVELHDEVRQSLEAVAMPMPPNPSVQPMTTWTTDRLLPIPLTRGTQRATMQTTYTFLGTRTRNGRQEALVGIKGVLRAAENENFHLSGRADGSAVFDIAGGQVTAADLTTINDLNVNIGSISVQMGSKVELKLDRALSGN
jgi:S1-C subfamily serine protease